MKFVVPNHLVLELVGSFVQVFFPKSFCVKMNEGSLETIGVVQFREKKYQEREGENDRDKHTYIVLYT